ncbi:MAG: molybdenum cofactor biosynthesis protein MoaE [Candidatus Obscuribacterales bacterium]|nr:molybdenum cofactor biosynthesis protein MoaE [Candidatus Obscuribacterales bacterium]
MFALETAAIDSEALERALDNPAAGALVSFLGRVRNSNDGKDVRSLEYEAYPALAEKEGSKIIQEAMSRFPVLEIRAIHRLGALEIGDLAVWVAVSSRHRAEAFEACRYVIDQIKARVPIWKKEFYLDGSSVWVNCAECAAAAHHHAGAAHD